MVPRRWHRNVVAWLDRCFARDDPRCGRDRGGLASLRTSSDGGAGVGASTDVGTGAPRRTKHRRASSRNTACRRITSSAAVFSAKPLSCAQRACCAAFRSRSCTASSIGSAVRSTHGACTARARAAGSRGPRRRVTAHGIRRRSRCREAQPTASPRTAISPHGPPRGTTRAMSLRLQINLCSPA